MFFLDDPKRTKETLVKQSFANTRLTEQQVTLIADSMLRKYGGLSIHTQTSLTSEFLRPLFAFFQTSEILWPTTSSEWQMAVYSFFKFYLTDSSWGQLKMWTRLRTWQTRIGMLMEFLVEDEVIPLDVKIPRIEGKKIQSLANNQPLLAKPNGSVVDITTQPKKLLVDINFGLPNAEYLDEVEKQCIHLIDTIRSTCLEHWDGLMKDREVGRKLAAQVTDVQIEEAIRTQQFGSRRPQGGAVIKYGSPSHPQGHMWALAILRRNLEIGNDIQCVSPETLRSSPFFPNRLFFKNTEGESYTALDRLTSLKLEQWQSLSLPSRFYRFGGLISNLDAAAFCCLMIIEHPELTSESIQSAKLLNVRGKPCLMLTDSKKSIFYVDKPRAGERKSMVLTDTSQRLMMQLLQCTEPVRKILKRAGDKTWRYLFLGVRHVNKASGILSVLEPAPQYLSAQKNSIGLAKLYPALSANGLVAGSFDYQRLRNTLGVSRWFQTGSILEMSRCLGNTRKVALEHYLPPSLLFAWNSRIIRRFQNTLIILAVHDEPFLFQVTDFSSLQDLQHFIEQIILDYPAKTSPLGNEVQKRLWPAYGKETAISNPATGLLNVHLSPKSLGLLYSYSDLALRTMAPEKLDRVDCLSGLAPRQFADLAKLLRYAAESHDVDPALKELIDHPLLKQVHVQALAIQVGFDAQFAALAIKNNWEGLQ